MKKKIDKEEKQEKIKRILKIVGCSVGLLLCGGAFIGLLFVGVRGCSSTPRSQQKNAMDNSLSITLNSDKETPQQSFKPQDINGDEYYPYVLGGYNAFGNYPQKITFTGNHEYEIDTYINGLKRTHFNLGVTTLGNLTINGYTFYNLNYQQQPVDSVMISYNFNGNNISEVFTDLQVGDILYFDTDDFDNLIYSNFFKYLFTSNVLRQYEDVNITFNNIINPFGVLGSNYDVIYKNDIVGNKLLFKGLFSDLTGQLYKSITLWFLSANGFSYGTASSYNDYTGDGVYFVSMYYVKLDGTEIYVNGQDFATATSGNHKGTPVLLYSNHWISSMFQSIHILTIEDDDNYLTPDYDRLVALTSLNNNVNGSATYTDGGSLGGTNPFVLIGSAFSSLIPFLTITIVPGITIGTLLLIPLVGMIVLFVVFLFKR